jgi:hypothetical protein
LVTEKWCYRGEEWKLTYGKGKWEGDIVLECFEGWYKERAFSNHKTLPCTVAWEIWSVRNEMKFQSKEILLLQAIH